MGGVLGRSSAFPRSSPVHSDQREGPGERSQPVYRVGRVQQVLRAQHVLCAHAAPRPRPGPDLGPGPGPVPSFRAVESSEARLNLRLLRGPNSVSCVPPSAGWDGFLRRTMWSLRHPGAARSPVTVRICPPERREPASQPSAPVIHCAGPSEPELRSPRILEGLDRNCVRPASRLSAFTPLAKRGALVAFVPRPGPLTGALGASGPTPYAPKRPAPCEHPRSPLGAKRNAICSSYSSTRLCPAPAKRGLPRFSPEIPQWPLRKREKGRPPRSVSPSATRSESSGTAWRPGQHREKTQSLPPCPGHLLPETSPPERGSTFSDEDWTLGKKAGQDAAKATADSTTEAWPGSRPSLCAVLQLPGPVPAHADPQLGSPGKTTASRPSPGGQARSEAPPALPPSPRAAPPPDPAVTTRPAPSTQSVLFGVSGSPGPYLSAPAPLTETSADSLLKPVLGSQSDSEKAGSDSGVAVAAVPSLGSSLSTAKDIKPGFGSLRSLSSVPAAAARSCPQPCPLSALAAARLSLGLVASTSLARTCRDPAAQLPQDSSILVPGSCLMLLLHPGFSPDPGLVFSPWQSPSTPTMPRATVGDQVPTAVLLTPVLSEAHFRSTGSPVFPSGLSGSHPPTLSLSLSSGAMDGPKKIAPQPALASSLCGPLLSGTWTVVAPGSGPAPARPAFSVSTQAALEGGVLSAFTSQFLTSSPLGFACGQESPDPGFRVPTQSHQRGSGGPVFGSMAPRPFAFGGLVTPMEFEEPGLTVSTVSTSRGGTSPSGGLRVGGTVLSRVSRTPTTLEKGWGQSPLGPPSQASPSSSGKASSSAQKPAFGAPTPSP